MLFLILGLALMALKVFEIGPVAALSWWWVLAPFALAALWWTWADASGYTKRKAMEKEMERKQARIDRQRAAMGIAPTKRK